MDSYVMACGECHRVDQVLVIHAADYGDGAELLVICENCVLRRDYRARLKERLRNKKGSLK